MKSKCFIRWRDTNQIELTTMKALGDVGLSDPYLKLNKKYVFSEGEQFPLTLIPIPFVYHAAVLEFNLTTLSLYYGLHTLHH